MVRWIAVLLMISGLPARAQEGCGGGCGDGGKTVILDGDDPDDGTVELSVDPFYIEPKDRPDPNRPASVIVGEWPAPNLDAAKLRQLARLSRARDEAPDDKARRYRLAEFYLAVRWFPYSEREFLAAAALDPESIRPWEGLLRVYSHKPPETRVFEFGGARVVERTETRNDWLSGKLERSIRIRRAYVELLKRRPGAVAHRRDFVVHLKAMGDFAGAAREAELVMKSLPGDANMRYEWAEALRLLAFERSKKTQGKGQPEWKKAVALLEENAKQHPAHVRTLLRLSRMLAHEHGEKVADRVTKLEGRAFFELFVLEKISPVAFRPDTFRLSRSICGSQIAVRLWDEAMGMPDSIRRDPDARFFDRWIYLAFPNSHPRERITVARALQRRGDQSAAGILLALLWHLDGVEQIDRQFSDYREHIQKLETIALDAVASLGQAAYPGAVRFLSAAVEDWQRKRGVALLRAIGDPRAVTPLIATLPFDRHQNIPLGVARALEEMKRPEAIDALVEAALDVRRPTSRRREAAEALGAFRDPRSVEAIRRLAKDPEFELVTSYALFRLTGSGPALERMRGAIATAGAAEVLRLAAKCESPRIEALLLDVVKKGNADTDREPAIVLLRKRFWKTAAPAVRQFLLDELKGSVQPPAYTLQLLGELGGKEVVDALLEALSRAKKPDNWEATARALALTGDPRAVRHFNRMRILERNRNRRKLARELHEVAAKRQAEKSSR